MQHPASATPTDRTTRPGPKGVPLLGSMPAMRRNMLEFLEALGRDYGDIAYFRLGPLRCVLVNRPEWIQRLLTRENARLQKPWDVRDLSTVLGQGLLTSEGDLWKRQRKLIQPAFHKERVQAYTAVMTEQAEAMLDRWQDGQTLDLHDAMSRVTLEIVARALFAADVRRDADVIHSALAILMDQFVSNMTALLPIPLGWPTPGNLRARQAVRRIDEVIYRIVDEHRQGGVRGDDLLSQLLETADEQGGLDDRQLRDELITLLLAGHETTALALSWTLKLLAEHPAVESRLVAEVETVLGGRHPRAGDERTLPYTRQVVEEGMRLYPPAWGIGREALTDLDLDGHPIRKGTQIFLVQWVTHRDARFFPDPGRFDPDRWAPERRGAIPRFAYFPFGGGPRTCIGIQFALLEATLVLAAVIQRYRVELVRDQAIELQPAVTLRPRHGIQVVVHER